MNQPVGRDDGAWVMDLIRIGALLHRELARLLQNCESPLSVQQTLFLATLNEPPDFRLPRLARRLGMTRQGLAALARDLETRGLVTLDDPADGGGLAPAFTDEGLRAYADALSPTLFLETAVVGDLDGVPSLLTTSLIERLRRRAEAFAIDPNGLRPGG